MDNKMKQYKNDGMSEETLRKLGESEAIATLCEDMLRDEAKIREFIQRDMTLGEKVLNFIDTVLKNFKQLLSVDRSTEASSMIADIEQARKLWFDALQAAKEKVKAFDKKSHSEVLLFKKRIRPLVENRDFEKEKQKFASDVSDWDFKDHGGYFDVGTPGEALLTVGIPKRKMQLDQSKALEELRNHSNEVNEMILKSIPDILNDPVVLIESYDNSVMVLGETARMDSEKAPVTISVILRVKSYQRGNTEIEVVKVRSIHGRDKNDIERILDDESRIVYLNEDKNRTDRWFQALGRYTPFGGSTYGPIKMLSFATEKSKQKVNESKRTEATTETELEERQGFMPDRTVNEDLQKAKAQFERVERVDEDGNKTTVPKIATEIATIIKKNVMHAYKDVSRNLDTFAKGIPEFRKKLQEVIERPLNTASKMQNCSTQAAKRLTKDDKNTHKMAQYDSVSMKAVL